MDKSKILNDFWNSFGIPAYDETTVPTGDDAPELPYVTYEVSTDDFGNEVALSASLWYYGFSWQDIEKKADEIERKFTRGGIMIGTPTSCIAWLKKGSPFRRRMGDPEDDGIRRIIINYSAEFISA